MFNIFKNNRKEPESLKEILAYFKKLEEKQDNLSQELADFKQKSRKNFQKIGMIRFNPFNEVGSDQSFCIALLDDNNNGFVITSHFSRELNRVYAKPIEGGVSQYQLSNEEKEAITRATGSGNSK